MHWQCVGGKEERSNQQELEGPLPVIYEVPCLQRFGKWYVRSIRMEVI